MQRAGHALLKACCITLLSQHFPKGVSSPALPNLPGTGCLMPDLEHMLLLFAAGLVGGAANALAGGGTFFTFPALLESGLSPISANATSTFSLWGGRVAAVAPQWRAIDVRQRSVRVRILTALAGGATGALLLLATGERAFMFIVPWLLLFATLLFIFSRRVGGWLRRHLGGGLHGGLQRLLEFAAAVYGGYFGAGLGVILISIYAVFTDITPNMANALKNVVTALLLTIAVIIFILFGRIAWLAAFITLAGAVPGGWLGGWLSMRVNPQAMRGIIGVAAVLLTAWYFIKVYWLGNA